MKPCHNRAQRTAVRKLSSSKFGRVLWSSSLSTGLWRQSPRVQIPTVAKCFFLLAFSSSSSFSFILSFSPPVCTLYLTMLDGMCFSAFFTTHHQKAKEKNH